MAADDPTSTARGRRRFRIPGPLRWSARVFVIVLIIQLFVVPQLGGARRALSVISGVNPALLAVGIGLELLAWLAYAQLLRSILPRDSAVSLGRSFRIIMSGLSISHVLPGGTAAGGVLSFRLLRGSGVDGPTAGYTLGTVGVGSAVVLNMVFVAALIVSVPLSGFEPIYAVAAGIGAVLLTLFAAAVTGLIRGRQRSVRMVRATARLLPFVDPDAAERTLHSIVDSLSGLTTDRGRALRAIGWAAANWVLDAASLGAFIAAFGHLPRPDGVLVAFGLANILAAIPITPGGLGVVEGVMIPTLIGFGVPRAEASIAVIAYRLVNFWLPIPMGGLAYLSLQVRRPSLRAGVEALGRLRDELQSRSENLASWARNVGLRRPFRRRS